MTISRSWILFGSLVAACGGGSGNNNGHSDAPPPHTDASSHSDAAAAALTCASFAYCSTYEVNLYIDTIDTPAGGTIADGIYRLAWDVDPSSSGQSAGFGDYAEAYLFQGGSYVHTGLFGRGSVATSGTTLTLTQVEDCSLGAEQGAESPPLVHTLTYTAASDRVTFFDTVTSQSASWTEMRVFLRVTDPCQTVQSVPQSPGDSYACDVSNCACNVSTQGTVSACD